MQTLDGRPGEEAPLDPVDPVDVTRKPASNLGVGGYLALSWIVMVVLAALLADLLPLPDPLAIGLGGSRQPPGSEFWFGTDRLGRDLFTRVVYGARISLVVGMLATLLGALIGTTLGLLAGYLRKGTETVIMGGIDLLLAFPALILALALTSFLGASVRNVIIAIGILTIPTFARIVRAQTLSLSRREFVRAARTLGATDRRILGVELLPNVLPTVLTYGLIVMAIAIVVEGALSFLGLGVPPPTPTWGGMIADGRGDLRVAPHMAMLPSAAMFLTVFSFNVLGERLRTKTDLRASEV